MSDEIKEILDFDFASQGERIEINEYERDILKDYITNLQQENEKLKNLEYKFFYCSEDEESFTLEDYLELGNKVYDLQQKVEQYENPDDLTLFYMWLDEKAKDKMKHLQQENERLNQLIKSLRGNIKDITKTSNNRKKAILDLMKKIEKLKKEIEFLKTSPFLFLKIEDDDLVRSYAFMKKELKNYK